MSPLIDEYDIGNDFIFGDLSGKTLESSETLLRFLKYPIRFDGYILFFCRTGDFKIKVNLSSYEIHPRTLMIVFPEQIIKLEEYNGDLLSNGDWAFVLISREFTSNIYLDFNKIFRDGLRVMDNPNITLDDRQMSVAEDYFRLARKILSSNLQSKSQVIGSLLTSLIYMAVDIWSRRIDENRPDENDSSARLKMLFERFLRLITQYHCQERSVGFYADKLCITPKYLSKLIKQVSGRSAPDWINEFVILEAKNMLKYTDMPIGQIVYHLNFPSQSVFYKFFKSRTGMTPSEYRRS